MHVEIFDRLRCDGRDQPIGFLPPAIVAGNQRQANEILRGDGVVVWRRFVGSRCRADDQAFGVGGGKVIGSRVGVGIIAIECALPGQCLFQIARSPVAS